MNFNLVAFSMFVPLLSLYLAKIYMYFTRLTIFIFSKRFDPRTFENRPSKQVYCGASDKQSLDKGEYPRHHYFKAIFPSNRQYTVRSVFVPAQKTLLPLYGQFTHACRRLDETDRDHSPFCAHGSRRPWDTVARNSYCKNLKINGAFC